MVSKEALICVIGTGFGVTLPKIRVAEARINTETYSAKMNAAKLKRHAKRAKRLANKGAKQTQM